MPKSFIYACEICNYDLLRDDQYGNIKYSAVLDHIRLEHDISTVIAYFEHNKNTAVKELEVEVD